MSDDDKKIVVIRRIKKVKKGGHHGGSWKIAYADFVTAMMAFFLLMWLLGLMNKYQLEGIAEYFQRPLSKAFEHSSDRRGVDKMRGKGEKTEKETAKEKPEKIDHRPPPDTNKKDHGLSDKRRKEMEMIKGQLEADLANNPITKEFKNQLNFQITADGLRIELRDLENKSMFTTGKADFKKYAGTVIEWLSAQLNKYPNRIVIIGHTDGAPYNNVDYTNWELSVDRANAARRALIHKGMGQDKIIRVIGVGDTDLLDKKDVVNPSNRRIEILILTDDAMKRITGQ